MTTEKIKDHYSDDVRLALLEQSINNINNTMLRFEKTFERIDQRFDRIDSELKEIKKEFRNDMRWLLTVMAIVGSTLGSIMAHGFHWF